MLEIKSLSEFEALAKKENKDFVLMFTAPWCGYCKMMKPIFEGLSKDLELADFGFVTVDRDQTRDLIEKYNFDIPTIPRFFLVRFRVDTDFEQENILLEIGGSQSKTEFKEKILAFSKSDKNQKLDNTSEAKVSNHPKVAVIGSGPAGLTAAIYTSRASLDTTVFTGIQPGGQLTTTTEIENFPGAWDPTTKEGIQGPDLMLKIQEQASHFGAKMQMEEVQSLTLEDSKFKLNLSGDRQETFDGVIIATGAKARYLGLEGEEKYIGKGYHSCATCDGFFYKGKEIIVVGGGDSAMEEAGFLAKFASKVYILNRSENFKASKIMYQRASQNPKIEIICNRVIKKLVGENLLESVITQDTQSRAEIEIPISAVFVAIGHIPNSDFVGDLLDKDNLGYLIPQSKVSPEHRVSKYSTATKIPGLFVAGDIEDTTYRQAITAAGDGCQAAMDLEKWLEERKD